MGEEGGADATEVIALPKRLHSIDVINDVEEVDPLHCARLRLEEWGSRGGKLQNPREERTECAKHFTASRSSWFGQVNFPSAMKGFNIQPLAVSSRLGNSRAVLRVIRLLIVQVVHSNGKYAVPLEEEPGGALR